MRSFGLQSSTGYQDAGDLSLRRHLPSTSEAAAPLIELAITEDIGPGDATSQATLPAGRTLHAHIVAKAAGVVAGLPIAEAVFTRVEPRICFTPRVRDGAEVVPGDLVAEVSGPGQGMLAAERTALNFLQHLSGIATLTRAFVDAIACTPATILDTRKTHPGYRTLEKYAVRMGGGQNHRLGLYDMVLIKDNHIDAAGSITAAVEQARAACPDLPIEVEVRNLDELRETLPLDVERIMLDNMSLDEMRAAVKIAAGRVGLEASGGVALQSVADVAATGVDYISVGALTHSAPALDLSMQIVNSKSQTPNLKSQISNLKSRLGDSLVILGHHYQRDEVIQFADFRGDSLKLAQDAIRTDARYIVFCGVHFMAETAAILARPGQMVLIPDPAAGCFLAETASLETVEAAWAHLSTVLDVEAEFTPVTYVNSSAALKAFCGRHGGVVCTSSNAARVLEWALAQRPRVFFFPDQHLGRNTALRMGIGSEETLLWGTPPGPPDAGGSRRPPDAAAIRRAKVVLWPGCCSVHQRFRPEHVRAVRERHPVIRVIVHPECTREVVGLADDAGSTAHIVRQVEAAPPGTEWAIGTEHNLVHRLAQEHPDQFIISLADLPPLCRTMNMITQRNLARALEGLVQGEHPSPTRRGVLHPVVVEPETAHWARIALQRMLELSR